MLRFYPEATKRHEDGSWQMLNASADQLKYLINAMAQRTFTLQEAQVLLPVLKSLLKQAIDGKKLIETIDAEFQELAQRIFLSGGLLVEIGKMALRRGERDKTAQRIKDVVAEIDATGVQVKDLDMGLLDFPCVIDGKTILLCWKMGEEKIAHWHDLEEGYAGRKPIDESITKVKKKPN
ncbi:MAG TPA: DUF2203 domain-containing protein [Terriglobales bacterium]|nr:DUF2203 domain-containing protein [Terriglobales bacterium]